MNSSSSRPSVAATLQNAQGSGAFALDSSRVNSIGRASHADVRLRDLQASKIHALIYWDGRNWFIADCSSNGTFLNGQKIQRHALRTGDVLRFSEASEWLFAESETGAVSSEGFTESTRAGAVQPAAGGAGDEWLIRGSSRSTSELRNQISHLAESSTPVWIGGEPGAGKRHAARALHMSGPRSSRPLLSIDCASVGADDIREVASRFGSEADARNETSASVLLVEVTHLSREAQQALLETLEDHSGRLRSGEISERPTRYVAISTEDPAPLVDSGAFDSELLIKLSVVQILIDPLRARREDIPELAGHFSRILSRQMHRTGTQLSDQVIESLLEYEWPGNVLELRNTVERAVMLSRTRAVVPADLAAGISQSGGTSSFEGMSLQEVERHHIEATLRLLKWKKSRVAAVLGIERSTLDRKIKRYGLRRSSG